jgi:DNA-binding winged helix-turn-helix (wHTH) protein/TolB-like protein
VAPSPSLESRLRFGPFELDLRAGELRRSGATVRLSPQPLKLLILLASRAGSVVTREEIRERLWGTDTIVDFEQGVNHCIRTIRAVLVHGPRSPVYIETLPRRGYRFIGAVYAPEAASVPEDDTPALPDLLAVAASPPAGRRRTVWAGMAQRVSLWLGLRGRGERPQAAVRLAVLPFDELTGGAELSGGLIEEISTHLSRGLGERLRLVSGVTARALKQMPHPIWAAREGGVDFLLGGSVRSNIGRARVNAHLVRVRDETQLWTESFERVVDDVLDFQSEVAQAIAEGTRVILRA